MLLETFCVTRTERQRRYCKGWRAEEETHSRKFTRVRLSAVPVGWNFWISEKGEEIWEGNELLHGFQSLLSTLMYRSSENIQT